MILRRFPWILLTTLLAAMVNVAVSVLWVAVYSHGINPGHEAAFYQEYAQWVAPYSSILAGAVIVFFACRILGRRWEPEFAVTAALAVWVTYTVLDLAVVFAVGMTGRLALLGGISHLTKLAAAYLGGRSASRASSANRLSEDPHPADQAGSTWPYANRRGSSETHNHPGSCSPLTATTTTVASRSGLSVFAPLITRRACS